MFNSNYSCQVVKERKKKKKKKMSAQQEFKFFDSVFQMNAVIFLRILLQLSF